MALTLTDECRPNRTKKTETAVNLVKPKPNQTENRNFLQNRTEVIFANRTLLMASGI